MPLKIKEVAQTIQDHYFENGARVNVRGWNFLLGKLLEVYQQGRNDAVDCIERSYKWTDVGEKPAILLKFEEIFTQARTEGSEK